MKIYSFFTACFLSIFFLIIFLFSSCEKMEDTYHEFVKDGEITYLAKADSLKIRGGKNRVEFSMLFMSDPKIKSYKILWNNGRDSLQGDIQRTSDIDTVKVIIDQLEQGVQVFEAYTFDNNGNSSVKAVAIGEVYGDRYQAMLLPRLYNTIVRNEEDVEVGWINASEDEELVHVEIRYKKSSGEVVELILPNHENISVLADFPVGGELEYRSAFIPDSNALDTFYTDYVQFKSKIEALLDWGDYVNVVGYDDIMYGLKSNGELVEFSPEGMRNISGDFSSLKMLNPFMHAGGIYGRDESNSFHLMGFNRGFNDRSETIQFANNWRSFDLIFSYHDMIIGRTTTTGALTRYRFGSDWALVGGSGAQIQGIDNAAQYIMMLGLREMIVAKTGDGKLWGIKLDPSSTVPIAEPRFLIDENGNDYDFISPFNNSLLAKDKDGILWKLEVDETGIVGSEKIVIEVEKLN